MSLKHQASKWIAYGFYQWLNHFYQNIMINKNVIQRLVKNSFWLSAAQGLNGVSNFILAIAIARVFGPLEYGKFAYALSFVMLFSTLFDFGLTMAVTREFARDQQQEKYFQSLFFLKMMMGIFAVLLIMVLSLVMTSKEDIRHMIMMLSLYQLFLQSLNLFYALFRARQSMEFEAIIRFFQMLSLIFCVVFIVGLKHAPVSIAFAYMLATLMTLLVSIISFIFFSNQALFKFRFAMDYHICKKFLLIGLYLALSQGVSDIMINTDSFLLGYWGLLEGAGLYYAVSKVNALVLFPMSIIATAVFPILISAFNESKQKLIQYWTVWRKYTVMIAFFIAFFVIAEAREIITLLYADTYLSAVKTLRILLIMAMVLYVNNTYFHVLLIFDQQRVIFYTLLCSTLLNVILNVLLIPKLGIEGSALATIGSQAMNGLFYALILAKKTFLYPLDADFLNLLFIATVSGILMWGILSIYAMPVYFSAGVGIFLYFTSFLTLRAIWTYSLACISHA